MSPSLRAAAPGASAFRSGRVVSVQITDFAPRGAFRTQTLFGPRVDEALRSILQRLQRAPGTLAVRAMKLGDIALIAAGEGESRLPVAFVYEGLTVDEITAGLSALAAAGWRP